MTSVLKIEQLSKAFGAVKVADDLCFDIAEGEALGILGPNGAGKTSMFNLITGALKPDSGSIHYRGADITRDSAQKRCRNGIARSFQIPQPFNGMTVFENCLVAATQAGGLSGRQAEQFVIEVLDETGLLEKSNIQSGALTLLDRKRLEMSRAMATKPSVLLLDEIAGGLTEAECGELIASVKRIRESGTTIVWIEHVVQALLAVVDRLIVLDFGKIIADGDPETTFKSDVVKQIYLGVGWSEGA